MEVDALAKVASADGLLNELDEVQYMPSIDLPKASRRKRLGQKDKDQIS